MAKTREVRRPHGEDVCKTKRGKREYNTGLWPTIVGGEGFRSRKAMAMAMPAEEQKDAADWLE
jgi:hypothetical protein